MKIKPLTSIDLIASSNDASFYRKRRCYDHPAIIRPDEIPIFPAIIGNEIFYSEQFVREAYEKTKESIAEDIAAIENKLGASLGVRVTSEGIFKGQSGMNECLYDKVNLRWGTLTGIQWAGSIWLPKCGDRHAFDYNSKEHSLPRKKAKQYAISKDRGKIILQAWNHHNITYGGFCFELLARYFAITFNNLAIEKLKNQ